MLALSLMIISCQWKERKAREESKKMEAISVEGQEIVKTSFLKLSSHLGRAMQSGGVPEAIAYCNLQASPIIDSLSSAHGVKIQRLSLKNRNTANLATGLDSLVIEEYARAVGSGLQVRPFVQSAASGEYIFYAPILVISPLCLACHGTPGGSVSQADYDLIRSKYPEDKAIGYAMGDLRGVWKIIFPAE